MVHASLCVCRLCRDGTWDVGTRHTDPEPAGAERWSIPNGTLSGQQAPQSAHRSRPVRVQAQRPLYAKTGCQASGYPVLVPPRLFQELPPEALARYRTVPEARIVAMIALAGWALELDDRDVLRPAGAALQAWVELGLPFRMAADGQRMFDPVETWITMKRLGCQGRDGYFREHYVETGRRLVTDRASITVAGPFRAELYRSFNLVGQVPGGKSRFRLPIPSNRVHAHRSITPIGDASDHAGHEICADRLELHCAPSGDTLTLGARVSFFGPQDTCLAEDRRIYLRPREGPVHVSERIHNLSRRLAGSAGPTTQAIQAFWTFLTESFVCGPLHYDRLDPSAPCDTVLDTGIYDCRMGAAVFIALCRARAIPARMVGGYLLYRRAPTRHFWAEYWCDDRGWTPVDFLGWDLSGGGVDAPWRDHFFGKVDARMVTEVLPLAFSGAPGVSIPPRWHMVQAATDGGVELALTTLDGRPLYTDVIRLLD